MILSHNSKPPGVPVQPVPCNHEALTLVGRYVQCNTCGASAQFGHVLRAIGMLYDNQRTMLGDICGMLKTDNDGLLAENARLRREIERLQRRAR